MRKIILKRVEATNFKNHEALDIEFGFINRITGLNGTGKSSVGEIVSWTLSGLDMLGSKLDPTPTDREVTEIRTHVEFEVDGKSIKFTRELVKGKAGFAINDIPKKATEFTEIVYSLTGTDSIDLFLSLYNPSYFPLMHWQDQRNMLFKYVSPPPQSEVLKKLPQLQADKLKAAFKKNSIADLDALHKKNKTSKEREVIAANSRVETLEGQLKGVEVGNIEGLEEERKNLSTELIEHENKHAAFVSFVSRQMSTERALKDQRDKIDKIRNRHEEAKAKTTCPVCQGPVNEKVKEEVLADLKGKYQELVKPYKEAKLSFDLMEAPEDWNAERVDELQVRIGDIMRLIEGEKKRSEAVAVIDAAKKTRDEVKASLAESIFLLDAIKEFNAQEAEMQAEKVQALFTGIQIGLWDHKKNGEKTPFFTIMMNGKPYAKLSLGEKARAGLELIKVLSEQSGIVAPVFFDNGESYTGELHAFGQIIAAYAVTDKQFQVEVIS
jgi:hypothetical protein